MLRRPTRPVVEYGERTHQSLPGPVLAEARPVLDALQSVIDRQMALPALRDILEHLQDVLDELWADVEP